MQKQWFFTVFQCFHWFWLHFQILLGFWHTLGSMVSEKRSTAQKSGQMSTHYSTRMSFPENGTYCPISAGNSSSSVAGRSPAKQGTHFRTRAEVKTLRKTVRCRYPPGIVKGTRLWTSRRPESAPRDTLKTRLETRVTLHCRKPLFSLFSVKQWFSVFSRKHQMRLKLNTCFHVFSRQLGLLGQTAV